MTWTKMTFGVGLVLATALTLILAQSNLLGPETFSDKNFKLQVRRGIEVLVYDAKTNKRVDRIVLDQPAISVKGGSDVSKANITVSLDWKDKSFKGSKLSLDGVLIKMNFAKKGKQFEMTKLVTDQLVIAGDNMRDLEAKTTSLNSIRISAPLGTSFSCGETGEFPQKRGLRGQSDSYRVSLNFPNLRVQAFDLGPGNSFGAEWECGDLFGIGLWVGLLTTLFFALVCLCGFTMLANIHTNDRFDDPKGKPIHVPQAE